MNAESNQAGPEGLQSVCVLGSDGPGMAVAGYLAAGGADVVLVADPVDVDAVNAKGLIIDSKQTAMIVKDRLRATHDPNPEGKFDLVLLSGRPSGASAALSRSRDVIASAEAFVSIQNSVDLIAPGTAGPGPRVGASITEFFERLGPGVVFAQRPTDVDVFAGPLDDSHQSAQLADALLASLNAGGLVARRADDIRHVIWEKQLQLANVSCWSVLMLAGTPDLTLVDAMAAPEGAEQFVATARELLPVYEAMGFRTRDFFGPRSLLGTIASAADDNDAVTKILAAGRRHVATGLKVRTWLHEDFVKHQKTEADAIFGPFIEAAAAHDLAVPLTRAAWRAVRLMEASWPKDTTSVSRSRTGQW